MRLSFNAFSAKRVILFSLLGLVLGLGSSLTLGFVTYLLLPSLITCLIFAGGGPIAAAVTVAAASTSFSAIFGGQSGLILSAAVLLPALITIGAIMSGVRYSVQIRISVFAHAGCMLGMLMLAGAAADGKLIEALVNSVREMLELMPENLQDAVLIANYPDLSPSGMLISLESAVRAEYIADYLKSLESVLSLSALPMLLQSALLTSVLSSYFPARILRKQGLISEEAFLPISGWFLPIPVVGAMLAALLGYLLMQTKVSGADTAFLTMYTIMTLILQAQGYAALDRGLCRTNAGFGRKFLLLSALFVFDASLFVAGAGLFSALFGRNGVFKDFRKNFPNGKDD